MTVVVLTSGATWTVDPTWNSANNTIETFAASGGSSGDFSFGSGGSGGGAWSSISNEAHTASSSVPITIGAAGLSHDGSTGTDGGDTWWNGSTLALSTCGSKGGIHGVDGISAGAAGGAGGAAASGVGTTKFSGGAGGAGNQNAGGTGGPGGGGGGAAGPDGNGVTGSSAAVGNAGGNGGAGDNGVAGGAGGAGSSTNGTNGTAGTANANGGGGGGGGNGVGPAASVGGAGGFPGGGVGGGSNTGGSAGGTPAGGQIRLTWTPAGASVLLAQQTDLPPARTNKQRLDFSGWQRAPLAANGPPTMALGFSTDLPYNDRRHALIKYDFNGVQAGPLSGPFVNASPPLPVYELPPRGVKRFEYTGFQSSSVQNPSIPLVPVPWVDVPRGKLTKYDFQGQQVWQVPADVQPPLQSSRVFDLPPVGRNGMWSRSGLFNGSSASAPPPNVIGPIMHMWLPLLGVGNGGP